MAYTDVNLYTAVHKQLSDLVIDDDTVLYTAVFRLKQSDILSLSLSDVVYVDGTNYLINKIKNFEVNKQKLTQVELVKIPTGVPTAIQIPTDIQEPLLGITTEDETIILTTDNNEALIL